MISLKEKKLVKSKKETMLKGIMVLLFSQISIKIIGLIYKLYLTNKSEFGDAGNAIYSSGFQIYALLLTFSSTGVPNAIAKLVSERLAIGDSMGAQKIFKIAFVTFGIIGAICSILLFIGSKQIAYKWIQIPEAEISLKALSPSIFFVSVTSVIKGYFNGRQRFSTTAKSQSIEQLFKTIFTIILVEIVSFTIGNNTKLMAGAANLATTLATVFSFIYIYLFYKIERRQINREIKLNKNYQITRIRKTIKNVLNVTFPISISSLISSFNKNIDSFTIVRYLKLHMEEEQAKIQYGILSGKVDVLCALPFALNIAFITTLIPNISKSMAINNYSDIKEKSKLFILLSIIISFPITAFFYIFSNEILCLLFPNASLGAIYLKYNSISIIFMLLAQTVNSILQGIGKVNVPAISFGVGMIMKLLLNIILIPIKSIGIFGAIIGNIICNFSAFVIGFIVLKKTLNIKIELKTFIFKPLFATSIMVIISLFLYKKMNAIKLGKVAIILLFIVGIVIYFLALNVLKIVNKEQINQIIKKK